MGVEAVSAGREARPTLQQIGEVDRDEEQEDGDEKEQEQEDDDNTLPVLSNCEDSDDDQDD